MLNVLHVIMCPAIKIKKISQPLITALFTHYCSLFLSGRQLEVAK